MPRIRVVLASLLFASAGLAAPLTRDLGHNLAYYRVHAVPADLPVGESVRRQPCVLDLRFARADADAATALQGWIKFQATPHTPVLALVNDETSPAILAAFARRGAETSVVIIGPPMRRLTPDIVAETTPDDDRLAYDALEHGTDVAALLTENPDKVRNDEASLAHDHSTDPENQAEDAPKNRPARPPLDVTLERAVHVDRALVALRKL